MGFKKSGTDIHVYLFIRSNKILTVIALHADAVILIKEAEGEN